MYGYTDVDAKATSWVRSTSYFRDGAVTLRVTWPPFNVGSERTGVVMTEFPASWSRPSTHDRHGPGDAARTRASIASKSVSDSVSSTDRVYARRRSRSGPSPGLCGGAAAGRC